MLRRERRSGSFSKPIMPARSTRITSAPWSASIIAANGAGPIPPISTILMPCNGPAMAAPCTACAVSDKPTLRCPATYGPGNCPLRARLTPALNQERIMHFPERAGRILRWWRLPFWLLAIFTGAKSFVDNPILGSRKLNRAGLHAWRVKAAHGLARWRRRRLARLLPAELRSAFDRDGFVVVRDFLPGDEFQHLRSGLLESELPSRAHQQGDTLTRRVAVDPELRGRFPQLDRLLDNASGPGCWPMWRAREAGRSIMCRRSSAEWSKVRPIRSFSFMPIPSIPQ